MEFISVFNDVLGPVMRGPSSSHTAGTHRIGLLVRSQLEEEPVSVNITFDPRGSYARTYREQGADLAIISGLLGFPLTDDRFFRALDIAAEKGWKVDFGLSKLERADHPNFLRLRIDGKKQRLAVEARSIGGGRVEITRLNDISFSVTGKAFEYVLVNESGSDHLLTQLKNTPGFIDSSQLSVQENKSVIVAQFHSRLPRQVFRQLESTVDVKKIREFPPVFKTRRGNPLFSSALEMINLAEARSQSLGEAALDYETTLLGISKEEALDEMIRCFEIMKNSVLQGLDHNNIRMQFLQPTAHRINGKERAGELATGGIHTRAAIKAMAVMHTCNSGGIVCAAPTGGSAGTLPGVMVSLAEEKKLKPLQIGLGLFAASAIGLIIGRRATFAAETAGCQVEIGAAGAMAAAALVENAGGSVRLACDAAAISLQNTMGSVCDLVQGACEIPCHTRNAVAASSAFVCADLVLGGYINPIPLDETIDAMLSVGKMLPPELRCTSRGGLATTPSAQKIVNARKKQPGKS